MNCIQAKSCSPAGLTIRCCGVSWSVEEDSAINYSRKGSLQDSISMRWEISEVWRRTRSPARYIAIYMFLTICANDDE
jgi:hypothetical protein